MCVPTQLCIPLFKTGIIPQTYNSNTFCLIREFFSCSDFRTYIARYFTKKGYQNVHFNSLNLSIHIYSDFIWSAFLMCNPTVVYLFINISSMFCLHFLSHFISIKFLKNFSGLQPPFIYHKKQEAFAQFSLSLCWSLQSQIIFLCRFEWS